MTTFTKLGDGDTPLIEVDAKKILSKIDPLMYGGFTEHMGRCIYGGMYDPGNALSDERGFRKDVLDALRDLDIPVIRYPGGNFVATYHWLDGVGPRDKRPKRPELAWLGTESNQFGTDEFMEWLSVLSEGKKQRVEPYICLNMGTGTLDEALAWVEYCNGTKDTYYANLRRQYGHEEPYRVKYWALGNEIWGPWQVEQMTKEDYAKKAAQWAKALRLLDPSLCLILCGETGHSSWDHHVLKECVSVVDMHSIHIYTASAQHVTNVTAPLSAERAIQTAAALIDIARIENQVPASKPRTMICFDEWNVWDPERAPGEQGAEERYTLSDALAVGVWLNVFVRQSRYIGMANIAQTVNVISPLLTSATGLVKQTTWWPLLLFSRYMRGWTVAAHVSCSAYEGPTTPAWLQGVLDGGAPWLDVSAVVDEEGFLNVVVVNISDEHDFETRLVGVVGPIGVHTVSGSGPQARNTADDMEAVGVRESSWDGEGSFVFGKHSLTLLRWKAA
ncbi:Arabinosidase C [Coniella lustricola]|uniref:non-reducing end alpha-L-arabinofuranosidase n=1 Tax=Coniella lustricola TaxID=2025994 RepID=A0A2T3ABM1_9PEZI|nr:Arabinosidase C [Coniella lustricola]